MTVTTLDPTCSGASGPVTATGARASKSELELAPRPASLDGATVGIVMNRLADCELMFDALYEELSHRDDVAGLIKINKDSQAVPPTPEQWAEIYKADVVITGFGGCGSCSTRSMRDALDLEAKGIPAVSVVHTALVPAVRVIAEIAGRDERLDQDRDRLVRIILRDEHAASRRLVVRCHGHRVVEIERSVRGQGRRRPHGCGQDDRLG